MGIPHRRQLLLWTAALLGLLVLAAWLEGGATEQAVRGVVRGSAKLAVVLFVLAFGASSLHALVRGGLSRWALANRRHLGLSFALAHGFHLAALVVLGIRFPDPFLGELDAVTLVGGGLAYALLFAMAATSNDAAVRRLGRRRWRRLHQVGGWYLLLLFARSYGTRALSAGAPADVLLALLVVSLAALRIVHWRRRSTAEAGFAGVTAAEDAAATRRGGVS